MASSASSSFSTSFVPHLNHRYEVFLSFRGQDTHETFTSHLYAALRRKNVKTFIDYRLRRGDEIEPALLTAIEESMISLVVLSEQYAFSSWCLDELVHILKTKRESGQVVIPVFYNVDPSDVRRQRRSYGDAFLAHEERFKDKMDKVEEWRAALTEVSYLSGWDSQTARSEAELVEIIVHDVLRRLKSKSSIIPMGLVGIKKRMKLVESLLAINASDVRIVGLCGMAGIGKTMLASILFNKLSDQFDACCFVPNIRERWKRNGPNDLLEELMSMLLPENNVVMRIPLIESDLIKHRLRHTRVLLVLDDVSELAQLEFLAGQRHYCLFGPGSRVIVTTRNMQVLNIRADKIYKVKELDYDESLQLFQLNCFKKMPPTADFASLTEMVINYAKGNPLALKVFGSLLYGRSKEEWESALNKMKTTASPEIKDVLKISYDGIDDEERKMFLDIACFLNGMQRDDVQRIFDGFGYNGAIGLRDLIDKSLIAIESNTKIQMHDLMKQELGWELVRQESEEPGNRSRLWIAEDVCKVLEKNKGTDAIRGISLDLSGITKVNISPTAFTNMEYLRFLRIHNHDFMKKCKVSLSDNLHTLPDTLTYLHWEGYPLKSLPLNFIPENLVDLEMPYSQVEHLWNGVQNLPKLKRIDLSHSRRLTQIPDFSQAKNLESINLECCPSLVQLSSSDFEYLDKLNSLNMGFCEMLMSLPNSCCMRSLKPLNNSGCLNLRNLSERPEKTDDLYRNEKGVVELPSEVRSLDMLVELELREHKDIQTLPNQKCRLQSQYLYLSRCSSLDKFPKLPRNIKELYLSGTRIEQVPSSIIEYLSALETFDLKNCIRIKSLPENIHKLKSLKRLSLQGCLEFEDFPEILESMECLRVLYLGGTAIKLLPLSIGNLVRLEVLDLKLCQNLEFVPGNIYKLNILFELYLSGCSKLKLPPVSVDSSFLMTLDLSNCNLIEIPDSLGSLSSLLVLDLSGNCFESIPANIKELSGLSELDISNCEKLACLPELPVGIERLCAENCTSLVTVQRSSTEVKQDLDQHQAVSLKFLFSNCLNLNQNARNNIMYNAQRKIWSTAATSSKSCNQYLAESSACIFLPGNEIPMWFSHQKKGCSIEIELSPDFRNSNTLGFSLGAIVAIKDYDSNASDLHFQCELNFKDNAENNLNFPPLYTRIPCKSRVGNSDYMLLWFDSRLHRQAKEREASWCHSFTKVSFRILPVNIQGKLPTFDCCEVKRVGVCVLYWPDVGKYDGIAQDAGELEIREATKTNKRGRDKFELGENGIGSFEKKERGNEGKLIPRTLSEYQFRSCTNQDVGKPDVDQCSKTKKCRREYELGGRRIDAIFEVEEDKRCHKEHILNGSKITCQDKEEVDKRLQKDNGLGGSRIAYPDMEGGGEEEERHCKTIFREDRSLIAYYESLTIRLQRMKLETRTTPPDCADID